MATITEAKIETLIPRIYEAAVHPEGWAAAITAFCDELGVTGASLTNTSVIRDISYWTVVGVDERALESGKENPQEFVECNQTIVSQRWYEGHSTTLEHMFGRLPLQRTSYYQDVMRPFGLRDVSAIFFNLDTTLPAGLEFVQLFRTRSDPAFSVDEVAALRRLAPHLRTAVELARRVYAAKGVYERVMDQAARPMLLLGRDGRLLRANPAALKLVRPQGALRLERGRVVAALPRVTAELHRKVGLAIDQPHGAVEQGGPQVLVLPHPEREHPVLASVTPLHVAHPLLKHLAVAAAAVWLDDPGETIDPSAEALRTWFGLTPAEARVAIALTNGLSPKEIAAQHGLHIRTVRTQVESVFGKVGVTRTAQLVRVITRVADLAAMSHGDRQEPGD